MEKHRGRSCTITTNVRAGRSGRSLRQRGGSRVETSAPTASAEGPPRQRTPRRWSSSRRSHLRIRQPNAPTVPGRGVRHVRSPAHVDSVTCAGWFKTAHPDAFGPRGLPVLEWGARRAEWSQRPRGRQVLAGPSAGAFVMYPFGFGRSRPAAFVYSRRHRAPASRPVPRSGVSRVRLPTRPHGVTATRRTRLSASPGRPLTDRVPEGPSL